MRIITVEEHFSMPGTSAMVNMGSAAGALNAGAMDTGLVDRAGLTGLSIDDGRDGRRRGRRTGAFDTRGAPRSRTGDEYYLHDAVRRYPGRFAGFASLPWADPESAATELKRCVGSLGFVGAFVTNRVEDEFLDAERFDVVLKAAVDLGVPINIHPVLPPEAVRIANYGGLSPMVSAVFSGPG